MNNDIATRFTRDTNKHQMKIRHNDGLYRHLHFTMSDTGIYRFDLITVPGTLIFQGDGDSFVFSRIEDMFEFFRNRAGQINPGYWAEKVTSGRDQIMRYDQELLARRVKEIVNEALRDDKTETLDGLTVAATSEILDELTGDYSLDRNIVECFNFYANPNDRHAWPRKEPDFRFHDVWEWQCEDYYWWFLWACHAIVWGIAQYDTVVKPQQVMGIRS